MKFYSVKCTQYPYLEYVQYDYVSYSGFKGKNTTIWYNNNPILTKSDFQKIRNRFLSGYSTSCDEFKDTTSNLDLKVLKWLDKHFKKVEDWL